MSEGFARACIVAQSVAYCQWASAERNVGYSPQEAAHNVLEQSCGLLLNELGYHVAEDSSNSVKSLVGGTDVVETVVIQQNLLDDEDGNSLAELRTGLHDTQTERNDLGGQKKVDDVGGIVLD